MQEQRPAASRYSVVGARVAPMWSELEAALAGATVIAHGATPGWAAWLAAQLAEREPLVVVVAPDDATARQLEEDVRFFWGGAHDPAATLDEIASLPGIDVSPYAELSPDRSEPRRADRHAVPARRARAAPADRRDLGRGAGAQDGRAGDELASRGTTIKKGDTIDRDAARGAARRGRLDAHAGRRRAGHVRGARRRDRRLRAALAAPDPHRAVRRRGRVAALVRRRVAAHAAARSTLVHLHPVRETITTGTRDVRTPDPRRTPTRSRSRPRRPAG